MEVLVAVSRNPESCADPVAAVASFPWPAETNFLVLSVAEVITPPSTIELVAGAIDVSDGAADVSEIQTTVDAAAGATAASAADEIRSHGFQADGIANEGDPKSVIVDHAQTWGADLIVVGSCEKSRIEKFFVGSVSESVVKHAACSVLIVKTSDGATSP